MIHVNLKNPRNQTLTEGAAETRTVRYQADELWLSLDPYDQDGVTAEVVDNIVVICHVRGGEREVVYSTPLLEP